MLMHEANKALRHEVDRVQKVNQNPKTSLPRLALSLNLIFFSILELLLLGQGDKLATTQTILRIFWNTSGVGALEGNEKE